MPIDEVGPQAAKAKQDEGWAYLDVRTPEEFAEGHPVGAVNIPVAFAGQGAYVPNPDFVDQVKARFTQDTRLLLGCRSGGRSMHAGALLSAAGYSQLLNVGQGFQGWTAAGLPTE